MRWTAADGAPPVIYALAQGPDGYIWVGSAEGLFRFDGLVFEPIAPERPDGEARRISALLAARDGTIWVGYAGGAIGTYRAGRLSVDRSAPAIEAYLMNFAETRDGAVWAAVGRPDKALVRREKGRWQEIGTDWGLPAEWIIDIVATRDGALWVTTLQSVLTLREGARRFTRIATPVGHAAIGEDGTGRVWLLDDRGTQQIAGPGTVSGTGRVFATPKAPRNFRARFDARGNLWAANAEGIFRLRAPGARAPRDAEAAERFVAADGLTSNNSVALLRDREDNIWIGTSLGLDQFRESRVVTEPQLGESSGWGTTLQEVPDGSVYIGQRNAVYRVSPGGRPRAIARFRDDPELSCGGADGSVWVILHRSALHIRGDRVTSIPRPPQQGAAGPTGCAVDARGVLWVNRAREGLSSFASGKWTDYPPPPGDGWMMSIFSDADRQPLALYKDDRLGRFDPVSRAGNLLARPRTTRTLLAYPARQDLLLSGVDGLSRVSGGKLQLISESRYPWLGMIAGIVETPAGETWMIGPKGIVRLPTAALRRAFEDPRVQLRPLILDYEDGLPNRYARDSIHGAALGGDGRIWFTTLGEVAWVDPARLRRNDVPPPVAIRGLNAGKARYRDPVRVGLGKGISSISIQYAGLSFVVPQRVRFRYRLSGVDQEWVEAGGRREAFYTNLGPGTYRFEVTAANDDGVWNDRGAALEFTILPTFFQSVWFRLLLGLGFAVLATLAYRLRVRHVTARMQSRFDARIAERERIARELHDTLLQGFQGLVMRFQAVANRVSRQKGLRDELEEALDQAELTLRDGRARVRDLRRSSAAGELADALRDAGSSMGAAFTLTVEGRPRPLHPLVREEALAIGEEAIRNADQHARASRITVSLRYGWRKFELVVEDDGIGLPEAVRTGTGPDGHFGLIGMRERAARIDGHLAVSSERISGTRVTLTLSRSAAYAERGFRLWRRK